MDVFFSGSITVNNVELLALSLWLLDFNKFPSQAPGMWTPTHKFPLVSKPGNMQGLQDPREVDGDMLEPKPGAPNKTLQMNKDMTGVLKVGQRISSRYTQLLLIASSDNINERKTKRFC